MGYRRGETFKKEVVSSRQSRNATIIASLYLLYKDRGSVTVFFGLGCVLMWIIVAHTFKTLITGKNIGTKAWGARLATYGLD